jgi:pimeloyl-ACP methyl ester carboxylesterase
MSAAMGSLMTEVLGYQRYGIHGTDVGAFVAGWLGIDQPGSVVGIHTLEPAIMGFSPDGAAVPGLDPAGTREFAAWELEEGAYAHLQRTKPQTLSYALADSPVALAAWLSEKYRTWSDCDGDIERRYPADDLLTITSIYWFGGRAASSVRSYYERVRSDPVAPPHRLTVPSGIAHTPHRPGHPPREWTREAVERLKPVEHWVELPRGGHFASWEEPQLVAGSLRSFFGGRT